MGEGIAGVSWLAALTGRRSDWDNGVEVKGR